MKKIWILIIVLFLCGCTKNPEIKTLIISEHKVEYATKVFLYDLIKIKDGKILTPNYQIDTTTLKNKEITIEYEDYYQKKQKHSFNIDIVDETPPTILMSSVTIQKGKEINLQDKITLCGDNYDRNLKCEIKGEYDINKVGKYPLQVTATDSSGNKTTENFNLNVVSEINNNQSSNPYLIKDLISKYKKDNTMIGIDVSVWQDDIDWNEVKEAGVEFAMLRIGYGHLNNEISLDTTFKENIKEAKEAGIKVGVYFYSYAQNEIEAISQARWIVNTLDQEKLDLPIAFDWEIWSKFNSLHLNFYDLNRIAFRFLDYIEKSGYKPMIYGSAYYLNRIWDLKEYPTWLAHYTSVTNYPKPYYIWQISSNGQVPGINAIVDLDILYN